MASHDLSPSELEETLPGELARAESEAAVLRLVERYGGRRRGEQRFALWRLVARHAPHLGEELLAELCERAPQEAAHVLENPRATPDICERVMERLWQAIEQGRGAERMGALKALDPFAWEGRMAPGSRHMRRLEAEASVRLTGERSSTAPALRALLSTGGASVRWLLDEVESMRAESELLCVLAYHPRTPVEVLRAVVAKSWRDNLLAALGQNPTALADPLCRDLLRSFGAFRSPAVLYRLAEEATAEEWPALWRAALSAGIPHAAVVLEAASPQALAAMSPLDLQPLLESEQASARLIAIRVSSQLRASSGQESVEDRPPPPLRGAP